jgi:RimJ/RimL family protein N-acetyltransferase
MFPEMTRDDVFRLETRRLWLRWPKASDAASLVAFARDPAAAPWAARTPLPTRGEEAQAYILAARAANTEGAALTLAIAPRARPTETIGGAALQPGPSGSARLGFWIGSPHQGQGFGGEAVEAILSMAFGLTGLAMIETSLVAHNASSRRLLERLGFRAAGATSAVGLGAEAERLLLDRSGFLAGPRGGGAKPLPSMGHQSPTRDPKTTRALAFAAGQ